MSHIKVSLRIIFIYKTSFISIQGVLFSLPKDKTCCISGELVLGPVVKGTCLDGANEFDNFFSECFPSMDSYLLLCFYLKYRSMTYEVIK